MTELSVFESISQVLRTQFSIPAEQIEPQTRLAELDLDSIGLVELAVALEERFDLDFTGMRTITMNDRLGELADRLSAAHRTP